MKRWIGIAVFVIALFSLIVWRLHVNKLNAELLTQGAGSKKGAISVSVAPAAYRDLITYYEAAANIESPETVKIAPKVAGQIDYLEVHEGDYVTQGQVLVKLDATDLAATVRNKAATVAESKARLEQAQVTQNATGVGVGTTIQTQRAGVASAQADYDQAYANYEAQVEAADAAVTDAQGRVDAANATVANVNASIQSAEANVNDATTKLARLQSLYKNNFIDAQSVDDQVTTVKVQQSAVDVENAQLLSAQAALASAKAQERASVQQASITRVTGKANIESAKARLGQAQAALVNAQANTSQVPAYAANLDALQATVQSDEADLANAQATLDETTLTAPMSGFITTRAADPGSFATAGDMLLTLQNIKQVWVNLPVPEEEIQDVHPGITANVTVDSYPGKTFVARIIQINPSADPSSRQFTVRFALDNSAGLLKPGMFARTSFVSARVPNALTVPLEAIKVDDEGSSYVWVIGDDSTISKTPVTIGASDPSGSQILTGLSEGDKVVTAFTGTLHDGMAVRVGKRRGSGEPGGSGAASSASSTNASAPDSGTSPGTPTGAPIPGGATPAAFTPDAPGPGGHHHHHHKPGADATAPPADPGA